jgi:CDP-6-deoxy-D-xylo-4-hexulose-3-dehydrase
MELNAVLGLEQLKRLDNNIERRVGNLRTWLKSLDETAYYTAYEQEGNSNFALPLVLANQDDNLFERVCALLEECGVEYRIGTAGGGNQARQPYLIEGRYSYKINGLLETADHIHDYGLYVGNHTDLTEEQIKKLCKALNGVASV